MKKKETKNSSPKKLAPLKQFLDEPNRLDADYTQLIIIDLTDYLGQVIYSYYLSLLANKFQQTYAFH